MSNYIVRHGPGWKYKRAVPKDLQTTVGKKVWVKTLGSIGKPTAKSEGLRLAFTDDRTIVHLRSLTPAERAEIAAAGGLDAYVASAAADANGADLAAVFINAFARHDPDPNSPDPVQADDALEIFKARRQISELRREAIAGRNVVAKFNSQVAVGTNATSLVPLWQRVSNPRSIDSIEKMKLYAGRFVKIAGDIDVRSVTRLHAMQFRDALEKNPKISRSMGNHLNALRRLFKVAVGENLITANPFSDVTVRKAHADDDGKKPFELAQIQQIFNALDGEPEDFKWVVRLLAYHGARSGEICQLRVDDVTKSMGIPVLRIHRKYGSVKNKPSIRDVPIHPTCMRIVEYAKAAQGPWLFGSFPNTWKDGRAGKFQQLGSAYLRQKIKIHDRELTMHCLRHTWRTLAREIDMPESVSRAIMGHTQGKDDHAKYGSGPSLKLRAEWIAKIDPLA